MGTNVNKYGDISPRTAAHAAADLLKRAQAWMVLERSAQAKPLGKNQTKSIQWRRYNAAALATTPLAEGVTPAGKKLSYTDYTATLEQFGDLYEITDVIADTHEDPVFQEARDILAQQAGESLETLRWNAMRAGTVVYYAGYVAGRTTVASFFSRGVLRKVLRYLRGQKARFFTRVISGKPGFNTEPVAPAFFGFGHTDLEADLCNLPGYKTIEKYADPSKALSGEHGAVDNVRVFTSPLLTGWAGGGAVAATMINTGGSADVYPFVVCGTDFWATVPFKGKNGVRVSVINPESVDKADPMGQRGYVSWKTYFASKILYDPFGARIETAATLNPAT